MECEQGSVARRGEERIARGSKVSGLGSAGFVLPVPVPLHYEVPRPSLPWNAAAGSGLTDYSAATN